MTFSLATLAALEMEGARLEDLQTVSKAPSGWTARDASPNIAYPQDDGGEWTAVQVPLQELKAEAARILAVEPYTTIYLGVVGCLRYRSGIGTDKYVSGIVADLHMADSEQDDPDRYIPLYDVLVSGPAPVEVGMKVKVLSA